MSKLNNIYDCNSKMLTYYKENAEKGLFRIFYKLKR